MMRVLVLLVFSCISRVSYAGDTILPVIRTESALNTRWELSTDASFVMTDGSRGKKAKIREQSLTLEMGRRFLRVNGERVAAKNLCIESTNGVIAVNGVAYRGIVVVQRGRRLSFTVRGALEQPELSALSQEEQKKKSAAPELPKQQPASCKIKVLLDQLGDGGQWQFKARGGFIVWDAHYKKKMEVDQVLVSNRNQHLYINNKRCDDTVVHIVPCSSHDCPKGVAHTSCNGKTYHGSFSIVQRVVQNSAQNKCQFNLVNNVDLEDYVSGVLDSESWPSWPLEMQKVLAIACRTYALAMALRADKLHSFYHVKNTNAHQTYEGSHTNQLLHQAVDETRGIFMAYSNEPIIAMYDVCCGGVVPAHIRDFNFSSAPYLARQYACTHCKPCKVYTWQTTWRIKDFEELVSKKYKKIKDIKSITVSKKDKAGLVREVILKSANQQVAIPGKKLYSIMKGVKSFCFKIQKKGNRVIINGQGYGHHIGLCQWGAREMVRKGYDHKAVLQFYYPGVSFARMA